MTPNTEYVPPQVWQWPAASGGTWAKINRPIAGPTHEKPLPVGQHPLQLYGHFYAYAPVKIEYCINRFALEVKRQLDVLDRHLAHRSFMVGEEYSIADITIWPWYGGVVRNAMYDAAEFLDAQSYTNLMRWAEQISTRPAVQRGRRVNRIWGPEAEQLPERHDVSDF